MVGLGIGPSSFYRIGPIRIGPGMSLRMGSAISL